MAAVYRFLIVTIAFTLAAHGVAQAEGPIKVPEDQPTIQAAVDAASPGDKISIGPGIYNESIVIDVRDLRMVAREGLHSVVIDGTGLGDPVTGVDGIVVEADGVELRELVVRNFAAYVGPGVVAFRVGILVKDVNRCRLEDNLAHSNGDGIVLRNASHCTVEGNTARNNIHNGIFVRNGSERNRVARNTAVDNGPNINPAPDFVPAGVGCGIQLSFDASNNDIKWNILSGNGRGLQLDRGSIDNTAKGNVSTNNNRFGIAALAVGGQPAPAGNTIKNNLALANVELDLIDQGVAVGNIWKNNEFGSANF